MSGKLFFTAVDSLQTMGSQWFKVPPCIPEGKEVRITANYTCESNNQALVLQRLLQGAFSFVPNTKKPCFYDLQADKGVLKFTQFFNQQQIADKTTLRIMPEFIKEAKNKLLFFVDQHVADCWEESTKEQLNAKEGNFQTVFTPLEERSDFIPMLNQLCYAEIGLYEDFYRKYFCSDVDPKNPLHFYQVGTQACIIGTREKVKAFIQRVQDEIVPPCDINPKAQPSSLASLCTGALLQLPDAEVIIPQEMKEHFVREAELFSFDEVWGLS